MSTLVTSGLSTSLRTSSVNGESKDTEGVTVEGGKVWFRVWN